MSRFMNVLVPALVVGSLLGACGGEAGDAGRPKAAETLVMVDNAFEPSKWLATPGDHPIDNQGLALHSLTVDGTDIDLDVEAGAMSRVSLDLDPGEYEMRCKYHAEMTGTITIE